MANKFLRDTTGSVLVEYTIVFPVFIALILGTVDVSYMLYEWALANKAAYVGARTAVVINPVATNITNPTYDATLIGQPCFDTITGAPTSPANCPTVNPTDCTGAASGSCTNGYAFDSTAFKNQTGTGIFDRMHVIFPRLQPENVTISYRINNLGFVGRPGGLPMTVTVSIKCMTHQFYFIDALMGWVFPPPAGCLTTGPAIPTFASTLQSEDMVTN